MYGSLAGRIRDLTPGILASRLAGLTARLVRLDSSMWSGDYPDWPSAMAACRQHGPAPMCEAYARAYAAVRRGECHHERDSLPVHTARLEWPLLAALAQLPPTRLGHRTVLDFGGGFGSAFFQNRQWLARFGTVRWAVVETPEVVRAARSIVADAHLRFFESIQEAVESFGRPDAVVAAGVLSLVPEPIRLLDELAALRAPCTLIERVGIIPTARRHRLTRQVVPECIYRAESPFWFFAPGQLETELAARFHIAGTSASACDDPGWIGGLRFGWQGYVLEPGPR